MCLDFTALDAIAAGGVSDAHRAAGSGEEVQTPTEGIKHAVKRHRAATGGVEVIANKLEKHKVELERAREVYAAHQEAIQRSGTLRADILKGIRAGEAPADLLLEALECISLATGDTALYRQGKADLEAVQGWGLENPAPLHWQLQEAQERLEKLSRPELDTLPADQRRRITEAKRAQRELIERIEKTLH
jgi:hypothetical protein